MISIKKSLCLTCHHDKNIFKKTMVALVFEIDCSNIHMAMTLMNQDTTVLLHIIMLRSEIRCLGIDVFPLVHCLVDVVIKDEYP